MIRNRLCEICELPSTKEQDLGASTKNFFCSEECKRYATWRGKIFGGILAIFIGVILFVPLLFISIVLIAGGGYAIKMGVDHSKIQIITGTFAPTKSK
ncbi:MAG: hypothetical protein GPJ54_15450 [Candidatus Heimdallarchaeota archaeon]|nr:hypothetical protein [Candidatus Heimdallarchaeota archaeon]